MFKKVDSKTEVSYEDRALPRILISREALNKMYLYIDTCSKEIGWLGTVENSGNTYHIKDTILFEQEVSAITTDICEDDLAKFAKDVMSNLPAEEAMSYLNSIKVWGHSHVNMSAFASGTDNKSMEMLRGSGHDYFIRIIGNKKGDLKIDFYNYDKGVVYSNLDFEVSMSNEEKAIRDEIARLEEELDDLLVNGVVSLKMQVEEEIDRMVKEKKYNSKPYNTGTSFSKTKIATQTSFADYIDLEIFQVEGMYIDEDTLYELEACIDKKACREVLKAAGLYDNQTDEELWRIMLAAANEVYWLESNYYFTQGRY